MSDWVHAGLLYGILLVLCTPFPGATGRLRY